MNQTLQASPPPGPKGHQKTSLNVRRLWTLGLSLPVLFWLFLTLARLIWFPEAWVPTLDLLELAGILVGAILFWGWAIRNLTRQQVELDRRSQQLESLHAAALALTTELDLSMVLQKVVDLSRDLVSARYSALGVLDEEGQHIAQFYTAGLDPEARGRIGSPPTGRGLLGVLIREGKPILVPNIQEDERSVGFPPDHPPMHSLLGVPIKSKGKVIGDLYLTDKVVVDKNGQERLVPFTEQDREIVEMFATQAAIAIENAQLYRQVEQLAILQERERFGMDLHDGVIQAIYAVGLMLEEIQHYGSKDSERCHRQLDRSIAALNEVIRDIRNYILDLRPQRFQGRDLHRGLEELVRELRAQSFLDVELEMDSSSGKRLTPEQTVELLHVVQEALTNVRKHAQAHRVKVHLFTTADRLFLGISDDGRGIDLGQLENPQGNGIRNMRERISRLGGTLEIEPGPQGGTAVTLSVPLADPGLEPLSQAKSAVTPS